MPISKEQITKLSEKSENIANELAVYLNRRSANNQTATLKGFVMNCVTAFFSKPVNGIALTKLTREECEWLYSLID